MIVDVVVVVNGDVNGDFDERVDDPRRMRAWVASTSELVFNVVHVAVAVHDHDHVDVNDHGVRSTP
jgi:hypothetical protein